MHINVYSNEGGITTVAGKKKAKDGKVYPYIGLDFKNGDSIKFFGKTIEEVSAIVSKVNEAMENLALLQRAQNGFVDMDPEQAH